jgi:serine phosphatase RsbU (regulator of sigma subunit)
MKRLSLLFSGLLLFFVFTASAGNKADSLLTVLKSALKEDTVRVNLLISISNALRSSDPAGTESYAIQARKLAEQLNFKRGIARSCDCLASIRYGAGRYIEAMPYYSKALGLFTEIHEEKSMARMYEKLGSLHNHQGEYPQAKENLDKAFALATKLKNTELLAKTCGALANLNRYLGEYPKSLKYYQRAIDLADSLKDYTMENTNYNNMMIIYDILGNRKEMQHCFDKQFEILQKADDKAGLITYYDNYGSFIYEQGEKAKGLECINKARQLIEKMGVAKVGKKSVAGNWENLAYIAIDEKRYNDALEDYSQSMQLKLELNERKGVANVNASMGNVYMHLGKYNQAVKSYSDALALHKQIGYKDGILSDYNALSRAYAALKDFAKAYESHVAYSTIADSIFSEKNSEQVAQLETRFEADKKAKEIQLLNKDKNIQQLELNNREKDLNRQRIISISSILSVLLVLGLVFLLYNRNKLKQHVNEQLALQNAIIEEKNKDITDSILYAKRIQQAILPVDDEVKRKFGDMMILYKPRDIVSGDFYWFSPTEKGAVLAVADCTGHGVPGAFMSMIGHDLLNQIVNDSHVSSPGKVLSLVDEKMGSSLNKKGGAEYHDGMDIVLCNFDLEENILLYAGAFRPLIIIREGEIKEYQANKFSIGGVQESFCKLFREERIEMKKGDNVYLFSDGFADQFGGEKGKKFKYSKLKELLLSISLLPMSEQGSVLDSTIEKWRGNLEQVDDILVVGVKV